MSATRADLVIQISASEESPDASVQGPQENGGLDAELRSRLKPGLQIVLAYPGYNAVAEVLWICGARGVRVGVRLLAVSALFELNNGESVTCGVTTEASACE